MIARFLSLVAFLFVFNTYVVAENNTTQEDSAPQSPDLQQTDDKAASGANRLLFMSGLGAISDEQNLVDPTISIYRIAFQHDMSDYWGFELGYLSGDSENFDLLFESLLFNQKTKFNAVQLGVYRQLNRNNRHNFYARLSANFYNYDFMTDTRSTNFSGTSYGIGLGWQFKLSKSFLLISEYNYDDFSRLDSSTFNIGFSLSF